MLEAQKVFGGKCPYLVTQDRCGHNACEIRMRSRVPTEFSSCKIKIYNINFKN